MQAGHRDERLHNDKFDMQVAAIPLSYGQDVKSARNDMFDILKGPAVGGMHLS